MKKEYESPEFLFSKVYFSEDTLTVSQDQHTTSEVGGDGPGEFGGGDGGDW